jgi:citrate synthase
MGNSISGLEGVVAAETKLSDVDGAAGRLIIAGSEVESLAGAVSFEEVFARLVYANERDGARVRSELGEARVRAWHLLPGLREVLELRDGMDALRASIARTTDDNAESIAGAVATFAAAWSRVRQGKEPVVPDASMGHAEDYLRMLRGDTPSDPLWRALDAYLVTVVDHGMNASTFVARVIASTGSDLVSSVTGAIGALKGPLHGGAPGPVLDMLDAVAKPERAEAFLRGELAAGRRIMGMGHRVYRVRDPRAAVLEREVQKLEKAGVGTETLALARATERVAERILSERHPTRPLRANVEFYTAVLLDAVGVPRAAFAPTFAVSRVAGWCAHVAEQKATGRLIRPGSRYIGPRPETVEIVRGLR